MGSLPVPMRSKEDLVGDSWDLLLPLQTSQVRGVLQVLRLRTHTRLPILQRRLPLPARPCQGKVWLQRDNTSHNYTHNNTLLDNNYTHNNALLDNNDTHNNALLDNNYTHNNALLENNYTYDNAQMEMDNYTQMDMDNNYTHNNAHMDNYNHLDSSGPY